MTEKSRLYFSVNINASEILIIKSRFIGTTILLIYKSLKPAKNIEIIPYRVYENERIVK